MLACLQSTLYFPQRTHSIQYRLRARLSQRTITVSITRYFSIPAVLSQPQLKGRLSVEATENGTTKSGSNQAGPALGKPSGYFFPHRRSVFVGVRKPPIAWPYMQPCLTAPKPYVGDFFPIRRKLGV